MQLKNMVRAIFITLALCPISLSLAENCPPTDADPNGYLNRICDYLVKKKIDVAPGSPSQYKIIKVVLVEKDGRKLVEVRLNCCYMGDMAIIDVASGEVVEFHHGPK